MIELFINPDEGAWGMNIKRNHQKTKWEKLCIRPFLIIDDYGIEPSEVKDYGNVMYPLDELLYTRYNEQSTTIITTNLTTDQLRHHCPERLYDRFKEMFQIVLFTNPSYRGQQHSAS